MADIETGDEPMDTDRLIQGFAYGSGLTFKEAREIVFLSHYYLVESTGEPFSIGCRAGREWDAEDK